MIKKSLSIALLSVTVLALGACSSDDDDATPAATATAGTATAGTATAGTATAGTATAGTATAGTATAGTATAGTEGDTAGTEGDTAGTEGDTAGTEGDTAGTEGDTAGTEGDTAGTEGDTAGTEGDTAGTEGDTAGTATSGDTGGDTGGGTGDLTFDPVTGLSPGGYLEGTLTAIVEANGGLAALQALKVENLDLALNGAVNAWTVILPNDAAVAAATGPVDVQNHIVTTGAFNSTDVTGLVGSNITVNSGAEFPIAGGGTEPLTIGGHEVVTVDLMEAGGTTIVHIIDGVLGQ